MRKTHHSISVVLTILLAHFLVPAFAESGQSTRVTDLRQHERTGPTRYPYRGKAEYILEELDLRTGDVVVDIGAGDGWWAERLADRIGRTGTVHAAEVDEEKVEGMKKKFSEQTQVKPYLTEPDSPGLPENSCDVAFFSQVYHHLDRNTEVEYLRDLRRVVKPTGRLVVIEKYPIVATRNRSHGTQLSDLVEHAERAGWVQVRCELMTGSYHYMAIFVQKELFSPEPEDRN